MSIKLTPRRVAPVLIAAVCGLAAIPYYVGYMAGKSSAAQSKWTKSFRGKVKAAWKEAIKKLSRDELKDEYGMVLSMKQGVAHVYDLKYAKLEEILESKDWAVANPLVGRSTPSDNHKPTVHLRDLEASPMDRRSFPSVKRATYCVMLPEEKRQDLLAPMASGFFVSPEGWFVTALHVLTIGGDRHDTIRQDLDEIVLIHPDEKIPEIQRITKLEIVHQDASHDFALLKAEHPGNGVFPHIEVTTRELAEGESVYCFGYPLSDLCETKSPPPLCSTFSLTFVVLLYLGVDEF
jgi:S1-C subfamily serine protease